MIDLTEITETKNVYITRHAYERGKERLGLKKKAFERIVDKAYLNGLGSSNLSGSLYTYFQNKIEYLGTMGHTERQFFRIYGENIFVFSENNREGFLPSLVTVMHIPTELKGRAIKAQKAVYGKVAG